MANNKRHNTSCTNSRQPKKPLEKPITKGAELNPSPIKLQTMYYRKKKPDKTTIKRNTSYEGETLEKKINRIVNNKEPIKDGAPQIYTDRRDGVQPQYDIRTDRFELAVEGTDYLNKSHIAKRDEFQKSKTDKEKLAQEAREGMKKEGDGGAETIQATDN